MGSPEGLHKQDRQPILHAARDLRGEDFTRLDAALRVVQTPGQAAHLRRLLGNEWKASLSDAAIRIVLERLDIKERALGASRVSEPQGPARPSAPSARQEGSSHRPATRPEPPAPKAAAPVPPPPAPKIEPIRTPSGGGERR